LEFQPKKEQEIETLLDLFEPGGKFSQAELLAKAEERKLEWNRQKISQLLKLSERVRSRSCAITGKQPALGTLGFNGLRSSKDDGLAVLHSAR
jgi:hypothetical protein